MSRFRIIIFAVLFMVPFSNANADELKSFLLKFTDAKDYPYELLEENYRAFIKIEENYLSVGKQELKKLYDAQAKLTESFFIKSFRILSRSDSEFFTTVAYEYVWKAKIDQKKMSGVMTVHSILRKIGSGWSIVFEAVSQD